MNIDFVRSHTLLLLICNCAWSNPDRAYFQFGVDVIAASDETKPVMGGEISFWRLKNLPTEIDGPLEGHGYTFGFEGRSESLLFVQYNKIGYAINEKTGRLPFPIFCLIGGGSIGPILKLGEAGGIPGAGINLSWWNYFGILGGISLEYKAFINGKPTFNISFFHRIGLPGSWWIYPVN